jgi:CheY-like chemotaxis protein
LSSASKPRILYVEDQAIYRRIVIRFFEKEGMEIRTAVDGRIGVAVAQEWNPDLILMDLILPEMDGFETAKMLRSDPRTSKIPIVGYSTMPAEKMRQAVAQAGMDAFFSKTAPQRDLLAFVQERLRMAA